MPPSGTARPAVKLKGFAHRNMTEPADDSTPHRYRYDVRPDADTAPARVIRMVGPGRRVLEFGCGPGSITRHLHAAGCRVTGVDADESALREAAACCERTARIDLNQTDWSAAGLEPQAYDVVLAADVLEHLLEPAAALRRMVAHLRPGGDVVLSIPHAGHAGAVAALLTGDLRYGEWGLLDRTHIRFFGLANIDALLEQAGLTPQQVEFVLRPPQQTELAPLWAKLPAATRAAVEAAPHAWVYQVVLRARRRDEPAPDPAGLRVVDALPPEQYERASRAARASASVVAATQPQWSTASDAPEEAGAADPGRPRILAYYLPQFHPFEENDRWWGRGFTEWTNASKARPLFPGHYQPHLPADLGFYDLRLPEVMHAQMRLARSYGISGFIYHYYWFSGKRLMERPLEQMLADPSLDMPFALCWANENWTRRWDAAEHEVLIAQKHQPGDDERFIDDLLPYLRDPRYIRIDGRPLLVVYRPQQLPDAARSAKLWRARAQAAGLPGLYLVAALTHGNTTFRRFGFDAGVEFPPHAPLTFGNHNADIAFHEPFRGNAMLYHEIATSYLDRRYEEGPVIRAVFPSWDNTARVRERALVTLNATPANYECWLAAAIDRSERLPGEAAPIVVVNAWNEWAEGCHLEPDRRDGHAFLEATRRVWRGVRKDTPIRTRTAGKR